MIKSLAPIANLSSQDSPEYPLLIKPQYVVLFGGFKFFHDDLLSYYNIYTSSHNKLDRSIDADANQLQSHAKKWSNEYHDDDENELFEIRLSRMRENIFDHDLVLKQTKYFASSMLVVSMWAMIEQYTGKALIQIESENGKPYQEPPHKWDLKISRFKACSIDIETHKSYPDINECRVLNNKIKHDGKVDQSLSRFSYFASLLDQELENLEFDLKRYYVRSFEYIGHVLELCEKSRT